MRTSSYNVALSNIWLRQLLVTLLILPPLLVRGTRQSLTVELQFSENDFTWSVNEVGEVMIDSKLSFVYPESTEPCIPLITKDIAIDGVYVYKSMTVSYEKHELMSGVQLASSPMLMSMEKMPAINKRVNNVYDRSLQYPAANCRYITSSDWGGVRILHFLTSPFIYDAAQQKVYFVDSIKLSIELKESFPGVKLSMDKIDASILKSFVSNGDYIDELCASHVAPANVQSLEDNEEKIDYVVITNRELADSFKPLCQWKTEKGLCSKVITVEDIQSIYSGWNVQLQIKNCLYDLYKNHGLRYVLLGGDDTIVPTRGCYGYVETYNKNFRSYSIPTDMYYACFDGCFDWDKDIDGNYGEVADSISLKQFIHVSRLPVCTESDVNSYIVKLLEYERSPKFDNRLLMSGVNLFDSGTKTQSDAELQGDNLFSEYIEPYWKGTRHRFFDTGTDFDGGAGYDVTANNLNSRIEHGYSFVDIIAHGTWASWLLESDESYDVGFGKRQKNNSHTIVTTIACNTNAFDTHGNDNPCLSESLIRNPYSGVVAYLGCSREGFGYEGSNLGPSLAYEGSFYKNLFSGTIEGLNFGSLVAAAKAAHISKCGEANAWRWIQFGLNPIGDPEMPIWISTPKILGDLNISLAESSVKINTVENGCRICAVDEKNRGENYFNVVENTSQMVVSDLPEESSICIIKPGYLPKQVKIDILQNQTISSNSKFDGDIILCGSSITTNVDYGSYVIRKGKTVMTADRVVLGPGTKVEFGAELTIVNKDTNTK